MKMRYYSVSNQTRVRVYFFFDSPYKKEMTKHFKTHNFIFLESSFFHRIATFRHINTEYNLDLTGYLKDIQLEAISLITEELAIHKALKINLVISLNLQNLESSGDYILRLKNVEIYLMTDLEKYYGEQVEQFINRFQELQGRGSNLNLEKIHHLEICVNALKHFKASSYIELDPRIQHKKAVINIQMRTSNVLNGVFLQHYIRQAL